MNLSSKIIITLFLISFGLNSDSISAQTKKSDDIVLQLQEYYRAEKWDTIISLSDKKIQKLTSEASEDSLLFAQLHHFKFMGLQKNNYSIENVSSIIRAISYCPSTHVGDSLKAGFYNSKAYLESMSRESMKSYKSISNCIKIYESIPNKNPGGLMGAYLLMSNLNADFGNFERARHYMRLAEDTYAKNQKYIDRKTWKLNLNHHRMTIIAKYRKIYMLWRLSKDSKDSLELINTMNSLEKMHDESEIHEEERIYYSTGLNHVGDWLISHKHDSLTTLKDVSEGLKYLLKSLYFTEKKGYPGTTWAIKYNIAKGYTRGNLLEKADSTMSVLFNGISKTDSRLSFFLAQKALIKAKKNQKDSALFYFYKSIQKVHQGKDLLKNDLSNFKPSTQYNKTKLLLRISEELNNYYAKDSSVQKKIGRLYYLALQQFENSYLNVNFNSIQNKQLRKIIRGILKTKHTGYLENNIPQKTILNKFEIFKNELAWKKFYENRYTNSLPQLDSVKERQIELASLLNKAKTSNAISKEDSIQRLISKHSLYKKKLFPQLKLLSDINFSIERLQENLSTKDLVLKYIILENEIAIYQISKSDFKVHLIPWTKKDNDQLKGFIRKTRQREYDADLGSQIGQLLIPSLDQNITNLIINPDGILFTLPFEILQVNGKLATEFYNFRYTSNLGFIHYDSDKASPSENIHIYAPHYSNTPTVSEVRDKPSFLKGASNEAKTISTLFPSKLFNDTDLTKSEFINTVGDAKLLHLAMHADVNTDYPELSRLLFSNDLEKEDEHLYLEELYGLSLSAELAILSACNTGMGIEKNGNLESFQRAFTFAGVPATVASLWEVPDMPTEQIMVIFYQNLKAGQTKSEALRNAKLSFRNNNAGNKLAAPYFWAGFVVYGSDTPVSDKPFSTLTFVLIAAIATPIIWYRRRKWKTQRAA